MIPLNLNTHAWILHGLTGSTAGELSLQSERLSFTRDDGQLVFSAPLGEVRQIIFPWHLFGCGLTFVVGADNYRISFARPGNTAGAEADLGTIAMGRAHCKQWKAALT